MANRPRAVVTTAPEPSTSEFFMPPLSPSDGQLLRSLRRLARDLSVVAYTPAPFLRAALASISRRAKLLAAAFDDLATCAGDLLPRSASLCLREWCCWCCSGSRPWWRTARRGAGCGCCCSRTRWRRRCGSCTRTWPRCSTSSPSPSSA
jgi:hypothetical protein